MRWRAGRSLDESEYFPCLFIMNDRPNIYKKNVNAGKRCNFQNLLI